VPASWPCSRDAALRFAALELVEIQRYEWLMQQPPEDPLREAAVELVQSHREVEPNLLQVFFYRDPDEHEVRLVEVVDGSPSAGEVLPFRFAPDAAQGVRFPVVIVELSPEEFDRVERGDLALPPGWINREELFAA
jgi:hypothetical protein